MRGIRKEFPGVLALDGVSLEVGRGEVVALCGENGAGKSTLLKILGGIYQADAGEIRLAGRVARIGGVADALRLGLAFIHQELSVLENLDVGANIFLGREPRFSPLQLIDRKKIRREAAAVLGRLGLEIASDSLVGSLPLAQRQMVEIARALSLAARLIIMDEPTSSLTAAETDRLLALVGELRAQGVSVIYVSHRLGEAARCADRVVVLRDGRNAGGLARHEISHEAIIRLMVGRDLGGFYSRSEMSGAPAYFRIRNARSGAYPASAVSLDVGRGEILGLAGLIGAGRSEIAQAIVGLDPRGSAEVWLGEEPVRIRSLRDAIAHGILLVPEDRRNAGLILDFTVRENISLPSLPRLAWGGLIQRAREDRFAREQIAALQVRPPDGGAPARYLSGGNQQKVVLAKWLAMAPRVLILDEPTRGIDVGAKHEIYALIRGLAARGSAVLMISSEMEEVLHVSDRVAVMHEGRVTGVLERGECTEENIMRLAVGRTVAGMKSPVST